MKKNKKDEMVYQFGEFIILARPVEEGFIHIVNVNTNWQHRIYMGANANMFLTLPKEEIYDRINSVYIISTFSMYNSEFAKGMAQFTLDYVTKLAELPERPNDPNDLETVKKDNYMKEILSKTDEEIMMDIASGEFRFDLFNDLKIEEND